MKTSYLFIALLVTACSVQPESNSNQAKTKDLQTDVQVSNGFGELQKQRPESFLIDTKEWELITKKRTRIKIPANAFETLDGKNPNKKVTLTFSEYQTSGEIMASKLPMTYTDPSGKTIDFESAGMFEIRAFAGDDELRLKKGKEIQVELATPTDGPFNFYQMDDNTRSWKEEKTNLRPIRNEYIQATADSIAKISEAAGEKPKKPIVSNANDKLIDIKLNVNTYPDFADLGPVMWKYMGTDPKKNPTANSTFFQNNYEFVSLSPTDSKELVFNVQFASPKDTIVLPLAPVYTGALKAKGEKYFAEKLAKFNESLKVQEALRKQNRNESQLLRVMKLDKLGVYNYDRQLKDYNIPVLASFKFEDKKHAEHPNMHVFLIPKGKAALIKYDLESAKMFAINPAEENVLIAVDEDNVVYALSDAEIRKLNLPSHKGKNFEIRLLRKDKKVKTATEMDQFIAAL